MLATPVQSGAAMTKTLQASLFVVTLSVLFSCGPAAIKLADGGTAGMAGGTAQTGGTGGGVGTGGGGSGGLGGPADAGERYAVFMTDNQGANEGPPGAGSALLVFLTEQGDGGWEFQWQGQGVNTDWITLHGPALMGEDAPVLSIVPAAGGTISDSLRALMLQNQVYARTRSGKLRGQVLLFMPADDRAASVFFRLRRSPGAGQLGVVQLVGSIVAPALSGVVRYAGRWTGFQAQRAVLSLIDEDGTVVERRNLAVLPSGQGVEGTLINDAGWGPLLYRARVDVYDSQDAGIGGANALFPSP
jgi:hypothetical protein